MGPLLANNMGRYPVAFIGFFFLVLFCSPLGELFDYEYWNNVVMKLVKTLLGYEFVFCRSGFLLSDTENTFDLQLIMYIPTESKVR